LFIGTERDRFVHAVDPQFLDRLILATRSDQPDILLIGTQTTAGFAVQPGRSVKTEFRMVQIDEGHFALQDDLGLFLTAAPKQGLVGEAMCGFVSHEIGPWEIYEFAPPLPGITEPAWVTGQRAGKSGGAEDALDQAYGQSLLRMVQLAGTKPLRNGPIMLPSTLDGLGFATTPFNTLRIINKSALALRPAAGSVAVVAAMRNEGPYVLEWLAHAWAVGFSGVFIYTNGNSDGSDDLLSLLHHHGILKLIWNETGPEISPQRKAYEHSLSMLSELYEHEWVAYLDCDEFLVPSVEYNNNIAALIGSMQQEYGGRPASAICINWEWYGSNFEITRRDGLLQERFLYSYSHPVVKSITRIRDTVSMFAIHTPIVLEGILLDGNLAVARPIDGSISPAAMAHVKLNHYYQKSWEEFGCKKDRGEGSSPGGLTGKDLSTFFDWDTSSDTGRYSPTPPDLLNRVKKRVAWLRDLPGVAGAEARTMQRHKSIADRFFNGDIAGAYRAHRPKRAG